MSDFLYGSICISEIPKELFKKADNGKIYLNVAISRRKEVSSFGDTHNIVATVKKADRKEGDKPFYIGNLKEWNETPKTPSPDEINNAPQASDDDLPF